MRPHKVLIAGASCFFMAGSALGMDFVAEPIADAPNKVIIVATGEISAGDDAKLHAVVGNLPLSATLVGIALNSPGGNYAEGVRLATSIHNSHIKTAVTPNGICASACFMMFAGGDIRLVFEGGRVGVHSASEDGEDTIVAEGVTTLMARRAKELGVPSAIIGKMVTTPPDQIAWLTPSDLQSMHVSMVDTSSSGDTGSYVPGSPLTPGSGPARPPVAPSPPVASAGPAAPYGYPSAPSNYQRSNSTVATLAPTVPAQSASFLQAL